MDIYVVQLNDVVIGAATGLEGAQQIADRQATGIARWRPWVRDGQAGTWSRSGAVCAQRIVRVPLAGYLEEVPIAGQWDGSASPVEDLRNFSASSMATLGYPKSSEAPAITKNRMIELMETIKKVPAPGKIRIGKGEALDWFRRAIDQIPIYPSDKTLPDSMIAQFMGFDVILDPDLPPNVMRMNGKVFVISGETVISIDETALDLMKPFPLTNQLG